MSLLTWHALCYPSRKKETRGKSCKHNKSDLNSGTCYFSGLYRWTISVYVELCKWIDDGGDPICVWKSVYLCRWWCDLRCVFACDYVWGIWPHLPICPSLSALVVADESPTSVQQMITGLLFCFVRTGLSHWYVACLLTLSTSALLLNSVYVFIELVIASFGPSYNI